MKKTGYDRMTDEMIQLHEHKGPHYDHWLKKFSEAIEKKGEGLAKQYTQHAWLAGVESFLKYPKGGKHGDSKRSETTSD